MSKRTIASIGAGLVAAGAVAYETWNGSNGLATVLTAAGGAVAIGGFAYFLIGKIAPKFGG